MSPTDIQPTLNSSALIEATIAKPAAVQPTATHRVFFGPYGLRAGWSLLIFVA